MNKTAITLIAAAFFTLWSNALGQGFVNLDFEGATIAPTPPGGTTYPADPAQCFPGWTVGGSPDTVVSYNGTSIGAPAVDLMGPDFPNGAGFTPLQGSYSVLLQYFDTAGGPPTLSQTGVIPAGTESINFLVGDGDDEAAVTLNGINVPLVPVAGGRLAGNIPAGLAGTSATLTFSTMTGGPGGGDLLYFDDVQFSSFTVPEPSEFALFALGVVSLGFRRWRKSAR